jgi:hypothetical protein
LRGLFVLIHSLYLSRNSLIICNPSLVITQ